MAKKGIVLDKPFGWRGRVGLIMPAGQQVTEPLYYAVAPEGVSFHTARMYLTGAHPEDVAKMEKEHAVAGMQELAQARVQCIAYMCVGNGLLHGKDGEKKFCAELEKKTGIPVISALLSVLEAFDVLKMRRLVVVDPYVKEYDEIQKKFLQESGFEVVGDYGLGINDAFEFSQVLPRDIYAHCKKVWDRSANGLYAGCCAFNAMPVAERLEKELNVPVVTAHTAVLWKVLRTLGIKEPIEGFGRLLREHL